MALPKKTLRDLKGREKHGSDEHRFVCTKPSPDRPLFGVSRDQALADRVLFDDVVAKIRAEKRAAQIRRNKLIRAFEESIRLERERQLSEDVESGDYLVLQTALQESEDDEYERALDSHRSFVLE